MDELRMPLTILAWLALAAGTLIAVLTPMFVLSRGAPSFLRSRYLSPRYRLRRSLLDRGPLPPTPERLAPEPRIFLFLALEGFALFLLARAMGYLGFVDSDVDLTLSLIGALAFGAGWWLALLTHDLPKSIFHDAGADLAAARRRNAASAQSSDGEARGQPPHGEEPRLSRGQPPSSSQDS